MLFDSIGNLSKMHGKNSEIKNIYKEEFQIKLVPGNNNTSETLKFLSRKNGSSKRVGPSAFSIIKFRFHFAHNAKKQHVSIKQAFPEALLSRRHNYTPFT
jgi:hypothetical protein